MALASGNNTNLIRRDWWFFFFFSKSSLLCSTTRKHEINYEYLVKRRSRYYCCRSTFEAWKITFFSSIYSLMTFSPHNFNRELVLNKVSYSHWHTWNLVIVSASYHSGLLEGLQSFGGHIDYSKGWKDL